MRRPARSPAATSPLHQWTEAQWWFQVDVFWSKWCVGRASQGGPTQKWLKVKDFWKNDVRKNFWGRENDSCRRGRGSKMLVGTSKRTNGGGGQWLDQDGSGSSFHCNEVTKLIELLFRSIPATDPSMPSGFGCMCTKCFGKRISCCPEHREQVREGHYPVMLIFRKAIRCFTDNTFPFSY